MPSSVNASEKLKLWRSHRAGVLGLDRHEQLGGLNSKKVTHTTGAKDTRGRHPGSPSGNIENFPDLLLDPPLSLFVGLWSSHRFGLLRSTGFVNATLQHVHEQIYLSPTWPPVFTPNHW